DLCGNARFGGMDGADSEDAVSEAVSGRAAYLAGQICNCAKRFIIHRSRKDEFVEKLTAALKKLKMGDPMDPETQVGSLISEKAAKEVENQVNRTIAQGARLILGGRRSGAFYEPTVLDDVTVDMDVAHDMEIFGPVFPVMVFDTFEEAVEIGNATEYGLGAGIMTKDMKLAFRFARQIQAGSVIINGQSGYRSLLMPFGGYKKSGYGREGLTATLQAVTQTKSIVFKNMLD
ncbi:MAG: aldehyde dehydrogenase family protein, partial [Solobacterium sp.]|nr:aldehyde dehydrogenase family protein [Solobacterium sp.]